MGHEWLGNADPQHWRESHYRAEGPLASQMQAVFIDNWIEATGRVPYGQEYSRPSSGDMGAQMFGNSPVGGSESMHLMVLLALTAAQKSIDIENAYFVPDSLTVEALVAAARRGVRLRVVVPGRNTDARVQRWAAQTLYGDLLHAGAEIYEYQPTMIIRIPDSATRPTKALMPKGCRNRNKVGMTPMRPSGAVANTSSSRRSSALGR